MNTLIIPNSIPDVLDYATYRYNRGLGMSHADISRVMSLQTGQRARYQFKYERDYVHGQHNAYGYLIGSEAIFIMSCPPFVESANWWESIHQRQQGGHGRRWTGD